MTLLLSGTDGLSDVDGTAATPAIRGTDTNTGIFFPAADTIAFSEGGVESMRLDSAGQLGIGFTPQNSQGSLQVYRLVSGGAPAASGTTDANQVLGVNASSVQLSYGAYANGTGWLQQRAWGNFAVNYDLVLQPNGGNLLVGQSSAPITASRGLYVAGLISPSGNNSPSSSIGGQVAFAGSPGSPVCGRVFMGDNTGWQWEWGPYGAGGWVRRFFFTDSGFAYNTSGTWGTISDARLKENIVDATPKLAELMQLRVRNFNFITEPGNKQIGFIAQEVEEIFPGLVDNSKPDDDGNSRKSLKTTVLIPMLIKAMQEQQKIIESLTARVAQLEAK